MECPQQFWIEEISIQLTHDAGTWCNKWHEGHTEKDWDIIKQDFLARFVLKDTKLIIIYKVKNLNQTGTMKEPTCAYKEPQLCAPSDMAFDTPATHLMYYNTLKLHVMRHVNLDQVTNFQSLYYETEKSEQTSNTLHKAQTGKREAQRLSPSQAFQLTMPLSEAWHRVTTGNPNLRIGFVLSLS
ncbi:hypothetical protein DSO57_1012289 [Entomophthora muscae]|uniref:Uncharacterized protein n=1 Tax=Entomophthora muscae TaxID=34485 RepID=A0ACC2SJE3_9FUNG|nr:hypothetical protein DSO57_1012289 [Entomophthora muscae]